MNTISIKLVTLLGTSVLATASIAQTATPAQREGILANPAFATMHLRASLGSFRLMDGQGRVEVNFTGSLLVSQLQNGKVTLVGKFEKQYDDRGRQLYYGKGKALITGKFRGIQWFGKDMNLVWFGAGRARLSGEYDKNLKTGELWYDNPKVVTNWPPQGSFDYTLPRPAAPKPVVPPRKVQSIPLPKT